MGDTTFEGFWKGTLEITGILERITPEEGNGWVAWCPEAGGVITQESTAIGAIAMLGDAVRVTIEDCLTRTWPNCQHPTDHSDCEWRTQRIRHPNRLIKDVEDLQIWGNDEWWVMYKTYMLRWERQLGDNRPHFTNITAKELEDGPERLAVVEGHLEWICAGGVVIVDNPFSKHSYSMNNVYVPALKVSAVGTETRQRALSAYARAATFDRNDPELFKSIWSHEAKHLEISQIVVGEEHKATVVPKDEVYWQSSSENCP